MKRWIAKHHTLFIIAAYASLLVPIEIAVITDRLDFIPALFLVVIAALTVVLTGNLAINSLLKAAVREMDDNCDPFPLNEECLKMMGYALNKSYKVYLQINRAAALSEMNMMDEALAQMKVAKVDRRSTRAANKLVYHLNMCAFKLSTGENEEARQYFQTAEEFLAKRKQTKSLKLLENLFISHRIRFALLGGELQKAEELAALLENRNKRGELHNRYKWATIHAAFGRKSEALEQLEIVLTNANRLVRLRLAAEELESKLKQE